MEVEKTIEFILEQQAQLVVRLDQLTEVHQRLAQNQLGLSEIQSRQQEMINAVITVVGQLANEQRNFVQDLRELREAQQQTQQNLNALIKVVDDLIRRDGRRR